MLQSWHIVHMREWEFEEQNQTQKKTQNGKVSEVNEN